MAIKTYITLKPFTGDISAYKCQRIELEESKAAELVKSGFIAEYYESDAIPTFDIAAMGAQIGQSVTADTSELYKALGKGIVKIKFAVIGNTFDWNVLAIKIAKNGKEFMEFSGVFMCNGMPLFIQVTVYSDTISIDAKVLSASDF